MKVVSFLLACCLPLMAETGENAWLRYQHQPVAKENVIQLGKSPEMDSAAQELAGFPGPIILGTFAQFHTAHPEISLPPELKGDGYRIKVAKIKGKATVVIASETSRGVLYGAFAFKRHEAQSLGPSSLS